MLRMQRLAGLWRCNNRFLPGMGVSQINIENVSVRLAKSPVEIDAAQHLRYRVFYEEYGAKPTPEMASRRRDFDGYDAISDHLIVVDESIDDPIEKIVGTYRLLRRGAAEKYGRFYTSDEYNISSLLDSGATLLELGRSCVLAEYRTRPVLQLLWQGITDYMLDHDIELMFGCASLHGTDVVALSQSLAYLYHYHLAPVDLRPRALNERFVDMNLHAKEDINPKEAFSALPALIKGYLRLGAHIGEGAVIDQQFNTTDICIVMPMKQVTERYRKFYSRKVNRPIPSQEEYAEKSNGVLAAKAGK